MAYPYTNITKISVEPGKHYTGTATVDVFGSRLAAIDSAGTSRAGAPALKLAGASDTPVGVFKYNAKTGETVGVVGLTGTHVFLDASAAIAVGQKVTGAADGKIGPAADGDPVLGVAITSTTATGSDTQAAIITN